MVARDRLNPPIGIDKVGTAIPDMGNRNLLTKHKRSRESRPATGRLALNSTLRFRHGSLHDLLKGLVHRICFDMKEIWMELAQNISRHCANGGIACHLSELMPSHSIGNNVQTEW